MIKNISLASMSLNDPISMNAEPFDDTAASDGLLDDSGCDGPYQPAPYPLCPHSCDGCPDPECCCRDCLTDGTVHDFLLLTDAMIEEILLLEEEIVRWRQAIMKYLSPEWADGLDQDIFSNLSRNFADFGAYKLFMDSCYKGHDPMESKKHTDKMWRLKKGTDDTSITYL